MRIALPMVFVALSIASGAEAGRALCGKDGLPRQVTAVACQSRFLALALSSALPVQFPADTPKQVTDLEEAIRAEIVRAANGGRVLHSHWETAVRVVSSNQARFEEVTHPTRDALGDALRASVPKLVAPLEPDKIQDLPAGEVLGISVDAIAGSTYSDGHVVSVVATDLLTDRVVVSNSWSKEGDVASHEGHVLPLTDIDIRKFGDGYHTYRVGKN